MTIQEEYRLAGRLHGHCCPGLAIGVRAAVEGRKALGDENTDSSICVIAERSACWLDGMCIIGATLGNGKLVIRDTGKIAFSFYNTESGRSIRLALRETPAGMDKEKMTQWLLTAPLQEVFTIGPTKTEFPAYKPGPEEVICSVCGESVQVDHVHLKDGKFVCCDCL